MLDIMEKLILWFAFILVCNWKLVKPVAVEPFNSNVTGNDVTNDALGLTPTQGILHLKAVETQKLGKKRLTIIQEITFRKICNN